MFKLKLLNDRQLKKENKARHCNNPRTIRKTIMIFRVHFKPTFLGYIFQNNSRIISITHNVSRHLHALSHSTVYQRRSRCSYHHPHFIDANTETQKGDLMGRKTETGGLVTMLYYFFLFFFFLRFYLFI